MIPRQPLQENAPMLPSGVPSLADAVNYIRKCKDTTVASSGIQQDIRNRIAELAYVLRFRISDFITSIPKQNPEMIFGLIHPIAFI